MDAEETAAAVWERMRALVLDRNERKKDVVEALGMSFLKAKALRRVAGKVMTMRELTAELTIDKPYTTLIVDDLERRGLVERSVHPEDRRCKIVTATPAGLEAAELAEKILSEPPAGISALDADELAALDRILAKVDSAG
jgi:DNA-binding MarR family transcriptional regulator